MRLWRAAGRVAVAGLLAAACQASAPDAPRQQRPREVVDGGSPFVPDTGVVQRLCESLERESGGQIGLTASVIESGRGVACRAEERFPMASTYKLPIALAVLARVDSGRIGLGDSVELAPSDFRIGPGQVADSVAPSGGLVTVGAMIRSMMMYSDNTATDRLMRLIGGPGAVMAHLAAREVHHLRVDRYEGQVHWDYNGVTDVPPAGQWTVAEFNRRIAGVPADRKEAARARFWNDPRDTSTPAAMHALLVKVHRGNGISPASRRFLLDAMERSPTGRGRIRALLPAGTTVADKTGTIGRTTNDVGIITLPDGSHVAIAVFVKMSTRSNEQEERTIARLSRAVYDHFAR